MYNLFVPYNIAFLAKEKGFDEECFGKYFIKKKEFRLNSLGHPNNYNDGSYGQGIFSAPMYQQIIDWFELKGVYLYAFKSYGVWQWKRDIANSTDTFSKGDGFKDKYKALNEAIKEAFKLIGDVVK